MVRSTKEVAWSNIMHDDTGQRPKRIGFVATRISGNDAVSLEIRKWSEVLERLGHT